MTGINSTHDEQLLEEQRIEMIDGTLRMFARRHGKPWESLTSSIIVPRYYLLGDKVIMVKPYLGPKPDPMVPRRLAFAYSASLAAVDGCHRLTHCLIGTLKILSPDGIVRTARDAPADYSFDTDTVLRHLRQ